MSEYWRDVYEKELVLGFNRQRYVIQQITKKFPYLKVEETGFGAKSPNRIPLQDHEKGEPDITIFCKGDTICYLEVSGSEIVMGPDKEIWIRPDKLAHAEDQTIPTWFYMVYSNEDKILTTDMIRPFKGNVKTLELKGRGIVERYILVPSQSSVDRETFFRWLEQKAMSKLRLSD
jgi:hypothetical protein